MFKKGDKVICLDSEGTSYHLTKDKAYTILENSNSLLVKTVDDYGAKNYYNSNRFELVADSKEEPFTPTIELDFLISYIVEQELESNEIIAFLKGYKKGEEFIHEIHEIHKNLK